VHGMNTRLVGSFPRPRGFERIGDTMMDKRDG
jgi:hypothetical protein